MVLNNNAISMVSVTVEFSSGFISILPHTHIDILSRLRSTEHRIIMCENELQFITKKTYTTTHYNLSSFFPSQLIISAMSRM